MHFLDFLGPIVGLAATVVGAITAHRITAPKDHERAALLAQLADDAAAFVVAANPKAAWADMLRDTINRISVGAGVPTRSATALENAAAAALVRQGAQAVK